MEKILYVILVAIIAYVYVSKTYTYSLVIYTSFHLNNKQKIVHCVMVWLLPFVWYYLFKDIYTHTNAAMTKDVRDKMNAKQGGFTESNTGING